MLQIFSRGSKLCRQITLLHSDLSNGVLSFVIASFTAEITAVAIAAGKFDRTHIWSIIALFVVFTEGIRESFLNTQL